MADIRDKLDKIYELVEEGLYFTINKPHQYGKTTIQAFLSRKLNKQDDTIALFISFEAIDYHIYQSIQLFINAFLERLSQNFERNSYAELSGFVSNKIDRIDSFDHLSNFIGELIKKAAKKLILIIDEVDRSSNNHLFLDFLAILRNRYLNRNFDLDFPAFHSVILSGVYDVKKIKFKIDPGATLKYNSPWNIAVDFNIDLSLNEKEIQSMLDSYKDEKKLSFNSEHISEKLHYYTSGHPFLTSYLCKIIDEELITERQDKIWHIADVDEAYKHLLTRNNTNFQSLFKTLENDQDLYNNVFDIIIKGQNKSYTLDNPIIDAGVTLGIFAKSDNRVIIHNRIYEQRIYNYMISKVETSTNLPTYDGQYVKNGILNVQELLLGFQKFMQENYSTKNKEFLEKQGTLLFLAFVKPIINGKGFDFKEVQISEERRLDVVITYLNQKYIIELKIWRGEEAHKEGLNQLSDYLDRQNLKSGYLLIYDFRLDKKEYKRQEIKHKDKDIFAVWV